jgi:hypothetical protein
VKIRLLQSEDLTQVIFTEIGCDRRDQWFTKITDVDGNIIAVLYWEGREVAIEGHANIKCALAELISWLEGNTH